MYQRTWNEELSATLNQYCIQNSEDSNHEKNTSGSNNTLFCVPIVWKESIVRERRLKCWHEVPLILFTMSFSQWFCYAGLGVTSPMQACNWLINKVYNISVIIIISRTASLGIPQVLPCFLNFVLTSKFFCSNGKSLKTFTNWILHFLEVVEIKMESNIQQLFCSLKRSISNYCNGIGIWILSLYKAILGF